MPTGLEVAHLGEVETTGHVPQGTANHQVDSKAHCGRSTEGKPGEGAEPGSCLPIILGLAKSWVPLRPETNRNNSSGTQHWSPSTQRHFVTGILGWAFGGPGVP